MYKEKDPTVVPVILDETFDRVKVNVSLWVSAMCQGILDLSEARFLLIVYGRGSGALGVNTCVGIIDAHYKVPV